MRKRDDTGYEVAKLTVDTPELCRMLSLGRASAVKVAEDAGAVIHVGRRTLYHVGKINTFLEGLTDEQANC